MHVHIRKHMARLQVLLHLPGISSKIKTWKHSKWTICENFQSPNFPAIWMQLYTDNAWSLKCRRDDLTLSWFVRPPGWTFTLILVLPISSRHCCSFLWGWGRRGGGGGGGDVVAKVMCLLKTHLSTTKNPWSIPPPPHTHTPHTHKPWTLLCNSM